MLEDSVNVPRDSHMTVSEANAQIKAANIEVTGT